MADTDHLSSESASLPFFAGRGEMGERTRTFDWSRTPVGAIAGWPQSLKTIVRTMLDSRYAMWLGWGPDFTFFYNDAYAKMTLGAKHPWALGRPARQVWSEIWADIGPRAESVVRTGQATWDEGLLLFLERQGFPEETYHTFSYSPVPDDKGRIGGMLCVVTEDTERTIGERRLRTLRELAARTNDQAKTVEEACQTAARTLAGNRQDLPFVLLYLLEGGGQRARLIGHTGLTAGSPPCPVEVALDQSPWPFDQVAASGQAVLVDDLQERFGPLPGGSWPEPTRRAVILPMATPGQTRPTGFVVAGISPRLVFNDTYKGFLDLLAGQVATAIANARAYEEERRRAEVLAELDRAKTAFFSNVSHEFRTPLTLMLGPVEDMLAKPTEEVLPENRQLLEVVHRNGLRLQRLVNTLLDFSRIEAGRVMATYAPTDLAALTADLASNFRSACEKAGLRLTADCQPVGEPVFVDRQMWEKVVLNLLSNAFKFTLAGEIGVSVRPVRNAAELRVWDTGTGIPAEEMPRLFERFHRVENARGRTHEGSGIGLALVQELVKLHGGSISATSAVGRGTTFIVTIPLGSGHLPAERIGHAHRLASTATGASPFVEEALRWLPDQPDQPEAGTSTPASEEARPAPAAAAADGDRPRVLVADDNADMRQYIMRLLADQYTVESVPDGEAALTAIRRHSPDLILTDVMMPRLDGFGLLRELRAEPRTATLPVIMLSARAGEESRVEGIEAGADDYLVKPFTARELLARVSAHLQITRLRRDSEQAIRQSEERFRALVSATSDVVYRMSADWTEMRDLHGRQFIDDTEEPSRSWLEKYIPADDQEQVMAVIREAIRTRSVFELEHRIVRVDGTVGWTHSRAVPLLGKAGEVVEWFGAARDITARKLAEAALRQSEERLAAELEATTRLHALSSRLLSANDLQAALDDVLHNAIVTVGADFGNIQLYNPQTEALEIVAHQGFRQDFLDYFRVVRVHEGSACAQAMQSGERIVIADVERDPDFEPHRRIAAAAGYRAVQSTPLKTHDGGILGMLSTHFRWPHRVSKRDERLLDLYGRHAADLIQRLRYEQALKDADRRKDEFLATLAHELRNPLAPLRNGLQVMKLAKGNDRATEQSRDMMERQLSQMVRLIDDLLDMSRISRGKITLHRQRVQLARVLQQAVETSRPLIDANQHELVITVPAEPIYVDADVVRLAQVFSNLLNNAAKYTECGGRITLRIERQGGTVLVSVKDTGIGIPIHMQPRVFEMFTQIDRSLERSQGGLGIGLSIVKRLTEMHGGSVCVRSEGPGTGSEFVVRLPIVPPPATDEQGGDMIEQSEPAVPRRILVVDDNIDSAASLATILKLTGNEVRIAHDGLEAVAAAAEFRPEIILLDVGMPRLNGYDACRRIREQQGKDVVVIALTGWGQEEDKRRSQEAGFDRHITKPVDFDTLQQVLGDLKTAH